MNVRKLWHIASWRFACVLDRMEWQYITAFGLVLLWATLICIIGFPMLAQTREMTSRLASHTALERVRPTSAKRESASRDPVRDFADFLPVFDKHPEQLRALNSLADKNSVVIKRIDYRYEQLPALPIRRLALRMDVKGSEAQQRRFLQATLNAFPNLSVARLAYAKNTDGTASLDQKLDVNLYYQSHAKAGS
jgi:hypothetical protein